MANERDSRRAEEALYEQVALEIASGIRREGLWAIALMESDGAPEKARARYIKLRAQSIIDDLQIQAEEELLRRAAAAELKKKQDAEREEQEIARRVEKIREEQLKKTPVELSFWWLIGVLAVIGLLLGLANRS